MTSGHKTEIESPLDHSRALCSSHCRRLTPNLSRVSSAGPILPILSMRRDLERRSRSARPNRTRAPVVAGPGLCFVGERGRAPMRRSGCHRWDRGTLVIGVLGILTLTPNPVGAQDPVIIPGLPGSGLQAGARPAPTAWPYSDLPGGKAATPTDATDHRRPLRRSASRGTGSVRATPCSTRGSIFARTSRSSTRE